MAVTDITVADVTSEDLKGTAIMDVLMRTITLHLNQEFEAGRIQGSDYPTVYLGAMQTVISQSIAFALQRQGAQEQAKIAEKQVLNTVSEGLQIVAQTELINAQEFKLEVADTALTVAQTNKVGKDEDKVDEEILLVNQSTANTLAEASNIPKIGLKTDAETAFVEQRKRTEEAQILDTVNALTVVGVVGKQKALYVAQTDGFARDAEQKAAKIAVDTWSVRSTVDPNTLTEPAGITDADITAYMAKLKAGVGA